MKTIKFTQRLSICLLLLFGFTYCSSDDSTNDDSNPTDLTFEETQTGGYEAMNRLFTALNSVSGGAYDRYASVTFNSEFLDDLDYQNDLYNSSNLLYNNVVADYTALSTGSVFVRGINRVAFKPGYYDLTTNPITVTYFDSSDTRVIFKIEKPAIIGGPNVYEYEMQNLAGSTKNASDQLVTYQEFTPTDFIYYKYAILPDFMSNFWAAEGTYIYRKNGEEIAKVTSTYEEDIEVDEANGNTYRKVVSNNVSIEVDGAPFCEYSFSSENNDFEITYYNEEGNFTTFKVTTQNSNPNMNLNTLYNSTVDNYPRQTFTENHLGIQMGYYKVLPVSCMGFEGALFDTDVLNITMSNATDELSLKLNYSRIPQWTSFSDEEILNTDVIDAVVSGTLTTNGQTVFTLSRDSNDALMAFYPSYNQSINAEPYFQENVTPLETQIEENIID